MHLPYSGGAQRLAAMLAPAGRWCLPWLCSLLVATALAHTVETGLAQGALSGAAQEQRAAASASSLTGLAVGTTPADPGFQWILLSATDAGGTVRRVACLTRIGEFGADMVQVTATELDQLLVDLPCQPRAN
jgi:hypothetical protein